MQQHKLKSDTEAQVVTDVIAEVLPSDQEPYQQTNSNESKTHNSDSSETSILISRSKYNNVPKPKPYTSDVDSTESSSCSTANNESLVTKSSPAIVENIVTPSVASDTVSAVHNPSAKENFPRSFNNTWKTPL